MGAVMAEKFERTHTRDDGVTEVDVEIIVHGWGSAGSYWEPPEGMEIEAGDATLTEPPHDKVTLTEAEIARFELDFHENPPEPDYPDDD